MNMELEVSRGLTLAFFWEPWDSGCRREWELIEKAVDVIGEPLKIEKYSVEESPELAERLNIRTIPTTLLLKDGKEAERFVGLRHEGTLVRHLKKHLEQET